MCLAWGGMVWWTGIMSERLDEAYIWVRQNLFPEWDEDEAWEIIEDYGPKYSKIDPSEWLDYGGECDLEKKHIYISRPYSRESLTMRCMSLSYMKLPMPLEGNHTR